MRIKVISDGTREGTRVVDAINGDVIENVSSIMFSINAKNRFSDCVMRVDLGEAEIETEAKVLRDTD